MREPKLYKPRLWALDAFWNRLKPSKRKELGIASGINSSQNFASYANLSTYY